MIRYRQFVGLAVVFAALAVGGALAGCGGGGSAVVTTATAIPFTTGTVFVADPVKNQIVLFAPSPGPASVPANPLAGSATQLNGPVAMAFDGNHNMYIANYNASTNTSTILGFSVGTYQNNAAPALTIGGSATTMGAISGIAVDSSLNIYVSNCSNTSTNCSTGTSSILIFPNQSGNIAPKATITNASLSGPRGIGFDGSGNLWVANAGNASVTVFSTPATTPTLKYQIQGAATGLQTPSDVIIDAQGNIYVSDSTANAIFIFGNLASGNAAPIREIVGSNTGLNGPSGMALSAVDGTLYVANAGAKNFLLYPPVSGGLPNSPNAPTPNVTPEATINNTLGSVSDVELSI